MSSVTIADTLRKASGWTIELATDHFKDGAGDADIATYCGERGWALVTCDEMRYTPETKKAIVNSSVRVLKVVSKQRQGIEIAASLVLARERIVGFLKKNKSAVVCHIHKDGTLHPMERFEDAATTLTDSQKRTARKYGTGKLF